MARPLPAPTSQAGSPRGWQGRQGRQGRQGGEQPHTLAWKEDQRNGREGACWGVGRQPAPAVDPPAGLAPAPPPPRGLAGSQAPGARKDGGGGTPTRPLSLPLPAVPAAAAPTHTLSGRTLSCPDRRCPSSLFLTASGLWPQVCGGGAGQGEGLAQGGPPGTAGA